LTQLNIGIDTNQLQALNDQIGLAMEDIDDLEI